MSLVWRPCGQAACIGGELREVRAVQRLCDMHTSTGNQQFFLGSVVAVMVMVACLFAPQLAKHGAFDLTGSIASMSAR